MTFTCRIFVGFAVAAVSLAAFTRASETAAGEPLNILWIVADDICPDLGCYGNHLVVTPNIDRLASQGVQYTNAFTTSPVCSASRSAFFTGMYQTTIGAHNHRSHREDDYELPQGVHFITDYFRQASFFTANLKKHGEPTGGSGKTDFNFKTTKPFDGSYWNQLKHNQPFFAYINFKEAKPGHWDDNQSLIDRVDPAEVTLPPYWPDRPETRVAVANYLDSLQRLDMRVGETLKRLEDEGIANNTIVIFFADHGRAMIRCKQWLYDGGIHVPLIFRFPDHRQAGTVNHDLISAIDITATTLDMAGIEPPANMQGLVFLGPVAHKREFIIAARDRCDHTVDRIRCVRTHRFKYIRNFMPEQPYTQLNRYVEHKFAVFKVLKGLHAAGELTAEQALFMAPQRPVEELYDLQVDPYEVHNLAMSPEYSLQLEQLRGILDRWIHETSDQGATLEDPKVIEKWDRIARQRHPLP